MRRGLLLGLALLLIAAAGLAVLPTERGAAQSPDTPQPNALGTYTVPADWPLIPAGIRPGHSFRLLFITHAQYFPASSDIADYNRIVQDDAAEGHLAIRPYASLFKIVGSTSSVDARDNTETNPDPDEDGPGVRIYWLDGEKVADDYADFYDGAWDSYVHRDERSESGTSFSVWTGSNTDGTAYSGAELKGSPNVRVGFVVAGQDIDPLSQQSWDPTVTTTPGSAGLYYGLSPVFTVRHQSDATPADLGEVPYDWELIPGGLGAGDRFRLLFLTSTTRDATESSLFDYDQFVQAAAAAGHEAIQPYARLFKVVGSSATIDARDHTGTRYPTGAPIYWLNGPRVATGNVGFWSGSWENWEQAGRRYESGLSADDRQPWTGSTSTGTVDHGLGEPTPRTGGLPGSVRPINGGFREPQAELRSFYALSAIFEVQEPPPRAVFSATWMKVDEPSACSSDTTEQFGPIHDRDLAMYTVRLSSDPGGEATVLVLDPSDSRSGFNRYAGNWGRITNQPVGDTSAVTDRSNSGTLLEFDSSNWEDPQTIRLNIHCADHGRHTWNDIWHGVTYPGDVVYKRTAASTTVVVNSRWQVTRVRVVDAGLPAQPADLSRSDAYAGTLTASLNGSVYTRCESTEPGGDCEWGFGVEWDWTTGAHSNDIWDAERHFWGFRFKVESGEGSDMYAYSYVPQPTSEDMIRPDHVFGWSEQRNDSPYRWGVYPSGLYTTLGSTTNPGNPVYRITVTPVTVRGQEVPGEADTLCVQLQSRLAAVPQNKQAVVVDCDTMFTAPEAIPGQFSPSSFMRLRALVPPTLTITSDAVAVDEGERVTFTITAGSPVEVDTVVHVSLAEELGDSPDRIGRHQLSTVTIAAGQRSVSWTATTLADEVDRGDGSAVATIMHGDGYTLGEIFSVSVALTDDDAPATPEISISGGSGITEGGTASFTITANPAPAADLDVSVTVSQSGDYGATTGQQTVTIPTTGSVTLTVGTTNDDADETDGSVTATLDAPAADAGYTVSATQGAATVDVADDDASSSYTVDPQVVADVKVWVAETHNGAEHVNRWQRVLVAFGELDASGVSGIVMSAAEAQTYADRGWQRWVPAVAELTALEASQSGQPPPELSISAGGGITEGGTAQFTISANPAPAADLSVSVTVSQVGDYGATTGARTLTIPTTGSVTLTVGTSNDGADEADGSVTATVNTGSGYTVSSTNGAATVSVADDDVPELSISAGGGITEGGAASFTITASPVPAGPITVKLSVSQNGDFGATGAATITLSGASTTYTVSTTNDQLDEADGSVTATLEDGTSYTVSSSNGAATVAVSDDDVPELSISAGGGITEGGAASFTITASPVPAGPITVKLSVSENGDFGATGAATITVSGASTTYTVSTSDDQLDEADGSVTATLQAGSGYTVSSNGAASVSVSDDDDPPVEPDTELSVSIDDASGTEGTYLEFIVRLSRASTEEVVVNWNTATAYDKRDGRAHSYDYGGAFDKFVFQPGVPELTGEVWLESDGEVEGDEYFAVELFLVGEEFKFRPDTTGIMTILDAD